MTTRLEVTRENGVAHVQLARPEKLNALDLEMFDALAEVGASLRDDRSVRAVVLSGQGRAFCAGLDVSAFMAMGADADLVERFLAPHPGSPANRAQQTVWTWKQVPVPVIAAIHGVCFGGGLQIALGADLRVVHPDAKLSVMEIKWGLIPDMCGVQILRDLVRLDVAKELTFSGRTISGREACDLGLCTRVADDPLTEALAMARDIAQRSPDAIRAGKRLLDETQRAEVETGLRLEAKLQRTLIGSNNQLEAVMATMQKRKPEFRDPEAT